MKRLTVALTLLLMSFLSALPLLEPARRLASGAGVYGWLPELLLAALAVVLFTRACQVRRRQLFPRRGLRLLAAGIALYLLAAAVASGVLGRGADLLELGADSPFATMPALAEAVVPQPVFVLAQLLLVFGAFRALTNLVPPAEFEADY